MFHADRPISLANAEKNSAFGPWQLLYRPKLYDVIHDVFVLFTFA